MDAEGKKREFLHSLSRITDRLIQVVKDYSRIIEDSDRIKRQALEGQEDTLKLQQAIESIFNDMLMDRDEKSDTS